MSVGFVRILPITLTIRRLDEATSHVDTETEALIERSLESITVERTTIVVAPASQRFATRTESSSSRTAGLRNAGRTRNCWTRRDLCEPLAHPGRRGGKGGGIGHGRLIRSSVDDVPPPVRYVVVTDPNVSVGRRNVTAPVGDDSHQLLGERRADETQEFAVLLPVVPLLAAPRLPTVRLLEQSVVQERCSFDRLPVFPYRPVS